MPAAYARNRVEEFTYIILRSVSPLSKATEMRMATGLAFEACIACTPVWSTGAKAVPLLLQLAPQPMPNHYLTCGMPILSVTGGALRQNGFSVNGSGESARKRQGSTQTWNHVRYHPTSSIPCEIQTLIECSPGFKPTASYGPLCNP